MGLSALLVMGFALAASVFYSLPSNVVSSRDGSFQRTLSVKLAQQSWIFFTKPPESPEMAPYRISKGRVQNLSKFPQTRPANWFGLRRTQRAQGPEVANLIAALPPNSWISCSTVTEIDACVQKAVAERPVAVKNTSTTSSVCGQVVILETEPTRWGFREHYRETRLPSRGVPLSVEC